MAPEPVRGSFLLAQLELLAMYHTSDRVSPAVGPWADVEVVATTPLLQHEYFEERDFGTGFWVLACYTCNRYFQLREIPEEDHIKYYENCLKKYAFIQARDKKIKEGLLDGRGQE